MFLSNEAQIKSLFDALALFDVLQTSKWNHQNIQLGHSVTYIGFYACFTAFLLFLQLPWKCNLSLEPLLGFPLFPILPFFLPPAGPEGKKTHWSYQLPNWQATLLAQQTVPMLKSNSVWNSATTMEYAFKVAGIKSKAMFIWFFLLYCNGKSLVTFYECN